jgi:hypothetical protein
MSNDLFDKYLDIPSRNSAPASPSAGGIPAYRAFEAKDRLKCLEIRLAKGIHRAPAYAYLLDVISDGGRGTEISLLFSFMVVDIRGRNLQRVAHSLVKRECAMLAEFDARLFTPPAPEEPLIERIDITVRDGG